MATEAHLPPQVFYEHGPKAGQVPAGSTKVGWTLRNARNEITAGFAFLINPQGIDRQLGGRASLYATRGRYYVDDFGPAPQGISVRMLVASGKDISGDGSRFFTARDDVIRFLKTIYLPATDGARSQRRVFFHDHHFDRGFEEHVFFPPQSLRIGRSVEQTGIWQVEFQMISLEKFPYAEVQVNENEGPARTVGRRYTVKHGDTLERIARKLAGKAASARRVKRLIERIVELNPAIKRKRTTPAGGQGKPMKVYVGEILLIPA